MEIRNIMQNKDGSRWWQEITEYFLELWPSYERKKLYIIDVRDCMKFGKDCLIIDEGDINNKIMELNIRVGNYGKTEVEYMMVISDGYFICNTYFGKNNWPRRANA